MLETQDLLLDKARFPDWEGMYRNVWSRPESARYMSWRVAGSESEARSRMRWVVAYQEKHDSYLVYRKAGGEPVGFAGVERAAPSVYQETGICLGPDFTGRGFGKQILKALLWHCKDDFGAKTFLYSVREGNEASKRLARAMHFTPVGAERKADLRDGRPYTLLQYRLALDAPEAG